MAPRTPDSSDADELTTNPLRPDEPTSGVQPSVESIEFDDETQIEMGNNVNVPISVDHPLNPDYPAIDTYGKYEILGRLAVGGMAEVFLARENATHGAGRHVAVKRILPQIADDDTFIQMFLDEARLAMRLNHPNICHIYDLGMLDNTYFIAMEWVNGAPLGHLLTKSRDSGGLPVPVAVKIMAQVADALNYAHQARDGVGRPLNIVHRDVSPQNVMVRFDGVVKLLDFGIAKAATQTSQTEAGIVKGKFSYMSPEQCLGKPLDARSDIFALGACLYEALTAKPAFRRASDLDTMRAIVHEPVPSARLARPDVPPRLDAILRKALAKDPAQRFQTAGDMYVALERFLAEQGEFIHAMHVSQFIQKVLPNAAAHGPLTQSSPSSRRLAESGPRPLSIDSSAATIDRHQSDPEHDTLSNGLEPVEIEVPSDDDTEQWSGDDLPSIVQRIQAEALAQKSANATLRVSEEEEEIADQQTKALPDASPFIPSAFEASVASFTSTAVQETDGSPSTFLRVLVVLLALVAAAGLTIGLMWTLADDEPVDPITTTANPASESGGGLSHRRAPPDTNPAADTLHTGRADTEATGQHDGQTQAQRLASDAIPEVAPTTGRLTVMSRPTGATVRVGAFEGVTPVTFEGVPEGRQVIHASRVGREDGTTEATVEAGGVTRAMVVLRPARRRAQPTPAAPSGTIAIDTNPTNTRVFYGTRALGRTPLSARLPAGTIRLRFLTPDGRSTVRSVRVNANADSRAFLPLGG